MNGHFPIIPLKKNPTVFGMDPVGIIGMKLSCMQGISHEWIDLLGYNIRHDEDLSRFW